MYVILIAWTVIVILIAVWISQRIDKEATTTQGGTMPRLNPGFGGPLFEGMSSYANRKGIATRLWNGQNVWAVTPVGPQYLFVHEKTNKTVVLVNNDYKATAVLDPNYFSDDVSLRLGLRPMAWRLQTIERLDGHSSLFDLYTDQAQAANLEFLEDESIFGLDDQMDANHFYCFMFDGFSKNWNYYMETPIIVAQLPEEPAPTPDPVVTPDVEPVVVVEPEPQPEPVVDDSVPKDGEFGPMVEDPTPTTSPNRLKRHYPILQKVPVPMKAKDSLGDRMKFYEKRYALNFMPTVPVICRIDGRSFHTFTKGLPRPYDERLSKLMIATTKFLVEETNARCGYTQSDEITLAWYAQDFDTEIFFGAKMAKLISVVCSLATAYFNRRLVEFVPEKMHELAIFDNRAFEVPSTMEAVNHFVWREQDAIRNSIQMAARASSVTTKCKKRVVRLWSVCWEKRASNGAIIHDSLSVAPMFVARHWNGNSRPKN
jgi:hypothetical protein